MMDIFKQTTQNRLSFIHSIVTEARQTENNHWVLSLENGDKVTLIAIIERSQLKSPRSA
jgi:hypothetical protein